MLGYFRHEVGHYYWDRLVKDGGRLQPFPALFGDESADYGQALQTHYEEGALADWQSAFVSDYARLAQHATRKRVSAFYVKAIPSLAFS